MWQVPMDSQYADDVSATAHPQIFHVTEWMTALGIFPKGTGWIEGRYQFSETSESQTSKLLCAPRPHFMRFHHSPYQIVLDLVVSVYFCIPLPLPLLTKLINMRAENTYLKSVFFCCFFFFFFFKSIAQDFPGSPLAKTLCTQCRGHRFDSWSRN